MTDTIAEKGTSMTDTPTRADLLPCPFCAGKAEYHNDKGPTGEMYGWVGCNQCDAMSVHTDTRSMQPEEQHPIDAWNTRAPTADAERISALEGEVERLRKALMVLRDLPIVENDNPDTLHIDGAAYQGPAVDFLFRIVRKIKMIARAALKGTENDPE